MNLLCDTLINNMGKCTKYYRTLDNQITKNIKLADIDARPVKTNGIWCCILLPLILNMYALQYSVSPLYKLVAVLSLGLLAYCVLFIIFLSVSSLVLHDYEFGGCISCSLISMLLMYTFLGHDFPLSLLCSLPFVTMFSMLLRVSLSKFPKTFTVGEAIVLSQGIVLFSAMATAKLTCNLDKTDEELDFIYSIIYTAFTTVGIIIGALCLLKEEQRTLESFSCVCGLSIVFALLVLHSIVGANFLFKIWNYLFGKTERAQLLVLWMALVGLSVIVLVLRTQMAEKANTVTRKSFHVLASLVFLSGILCDVNLITLAAGAAFALLVLIEALRKSSIDPISPALQSAFIVYSDEKDSGCFAVSAIYLLLGLAVPLALCPTNVGVLPLLSGVLAVGVGDSAASWAGKGYGTHRWPDSDKTYEGTAFNIFSQIATVYALVLFELLDANNALIRTCVAATITGIVEAKTSQVDNLVLPLVTLIAFQTTSFLA